MKRFLLISLIIISCIPLFIRLHILEKDFLEILAIADGIFTINRYCFQMLNQYAGIADLTGITSRPPLIPFFLSTGFSLFGHSLKTIYLVYAIPRLLMPLFLYGSALFFFPPLFSYLIATLPFFFPYFETYAMATLKADSFVILWTLSGLYFFLRWNKNKKSFDLLICSVCLTANFLSKETASLISASFWGLLTISIFQQDSRIKNLFYMIMPMVFIIGPFALFSIMTTNRLLPNLYATAYSTASFSGNILTYLASIPFYMGVSFNQGVLFAAISFMKLILLLVGIVGALRKKYWFLLLPPLAPLIGISLINSRVVQGDIIGNREILHRIAFIVPFVALFLGFGVMSITQSVKKLSKEILATIILFIVSGIFVYWYFRAPFALDYTDKEFYINAQTVFRYHPELPFTRFRQENNLCISEFVPAGSFLSQEYQQFKTSAFPQFYKELLITVWGIPLALWLWLVIFKKKNH